MNRPPDRHDLEAAYRELLMDLEKVEAVRHDVNVREAPGPALLLEAAAGAIAAVLTFLKHDEHVRRTKADRTLYDLAAGLNDLADGAVSPWLRPAKRTTKPPLRTSEANTRAIAILAMMELIEGKAKKSDAAKTVARAIEKGRILVRSRRSNDGPAALSATVSGWYERDPGTRKKLACWRASYLRRIGAEGTPAERAEYLLNMLLNNAGLKI